jgi:hypothetical protein
LELRNIGTAVSASCTLADPAAVAGITGAGDDMPISFEFDNTGDRRDEARPHASYRSGPSEPADLLEFTDADGVRWTVREARPTNVTAHVGETSLIFECATAVRRVWRYPEDWRAMTPEQLSKLSWGV